jgi:predicted TIM-barrel fold metal-dependent hydrolase
MSHSNIDIFCHILPIKYKQALFKKVDLSTGQKATMESLPALFDLEQRFRVMDKYEGSAQVLTLNYPPIEEVTDPQKAVELTQLANDEMAELVNKYPDRFLAAVAALPLNNPDAALKEVDRAINDLGLKGILLYTPVNDKPLDSPEFLPLFEKMSRYNLPVWIHPSRGASYPDYRTENSSLYGINGIFGWPYETTAAMTRLVFSGILEKYQGLKIITHHCGGMIPYFQQRILRLHQNRKLRGFADYDRKLTKPVLEYFKGFYYDTALYDNTPALMCAHSFCGADHMLFGTDMPHDTELGDVCLGDTIRAVENMSINPLEKQKIFETNARSLLHLPM